MRIVINGWFLGQDTAGSGQYLHYLLAHLARAAPDAQLCLLTPSCPAVCREQQFNTLFAQATHELPSSNVELLVHALPNIASPLAKLYWEQILFPRIALRRGADLLWVPYWAAPFWQPRPTVVTIHDLIPLLLPAYRGRLLQRAYAFLVSQTAKRSTAILTISQASARDIVTHLNVPGDRVFVVYHGPNHVQNQQSDQAALVQLRNHYRLPSRFFLYLGGFDSRKNVLNILHAYRRYLDRGGDPNIKLVIAGKLPQIDSVFAPDPQKAAVELDLTTQVHFCGFIPEEDKPALYALATAYIFPSLYEGFGMMILEAMSAGTPVVTSA
ncbi:glycosyltransferase family 4 protein [Chloroflexi bacterium TSY]|nr:glycosyltransferase family 4 protein [Chloroflexi bacterium TSY]